MLEIGYEPGFAILAWAQNALGIGKAELPGQGAASLASTARSMRVEAAFVGKDGSVRQNQLDAEIFLGGLIFNGAEPRESQIFRLGNRAAEQDRVDLRDGVEQRIFTAPDQGCRLSSASCR